MAPGANVFNILTTGAATSFFLCASVTDASDATTLLSGAVEFQATTPVVNQFVDNEQSRVAQDTGTHVPLTEFATGGAPPYTYAWYGPFGAPGNCPAPGGAVVSTSATYSPVTLAGTNYYAVIVSDSSIGTPKNSACSEVVVVGKGPVAITLFTISPVNDQQVGPKTVTATVIWNSGVGPWYTVNIYAGPETTCSALTKVASQSDINATEAILTFPMPTTPSTVTYYCATVTDSAFSPVTVDSTGGTDLTFVKIDLTPALSPPTFSISPTEAATPSPPGPMSPLTLSWKGQWTGGVSPYTWTVISGSSSNCASDTNTVFSGSAGTFIKVSSTPSSTSALAPAIPTPTSSTYFCLVIDDASTITSETVSSSVLFTVGPVLAVKTPVLSSLAIDVGQGSAYEGIPETATVTWSGGTGPYVVAFYFSQLSGADCQSKATAGNPTYLVAVLPGSNPLTAIPGFTATFHFLAPGINIPEANTWYCATVTDLEPQNPVSVTSGTTEITVSLLPLATPILNPLSPASGVHAGQPSITVTATVINIMGGTDPYTVTLFSGSSSSCSGDTTKVPMINGYQNPVTVAGPTASFQFASPAASTYYCAVVADSSEIPVTKSTNVQQFLVSPPLTVNTPAGYEIPAGTSTTIGPVTANNAIGAVTFTWYIGAGCVAANAVATGASYNTGILTQETVYSFSAKDSTGAFACSGPIDITVNNGPQGVASFNTGKYAGFGYVANPFHHSITVVDTYSLAKVTTIDLAVDAPYGVTVDEGHSLVYTSVYNNFAFLSEAVCIDASTNSFAGFAFGTSASAPAGIAYSKALGELFMANPSSNTVDVFTVGATCASLTYKTTVNVGAGPTGVAVDTDNNYVFVTNSLSNTVSVLQPTGVFPPASFGVTNVVTGSQPSGVAFDPSNHNVYVANAASGTITVINGYSLVPSATIKVGGTPQGIGVNAAAGTAYWANAATGTVGEINLATNAPMSTAIATGSGPFAVDVQLNGLNSAVLSSPALALVTNSGSNTLSVINIATNTVIATIVVP